MHIDLSKMVKLFKTGRKYRVPRCCSFRFAWIMSTNKIGDEVDQRIIKRLHKHGIIQTSPTDAWIACGFHKKEAKIVED